MKDGQTDGQTDRRTDRLLLQSCAAVYQNLSRNDNSHATYLTTAWDLLLLPVSEKNYNLKVQFFTITLANIYQFSVKFRQTAEEDRIKTITSPQICYHTTLRKVSVQLYSFTANLIQIKMMEKCLTTVTVHEGH